MGNTFQSLTQGITALGDTIVDGITDLFNFLFVPNEEEISDKIEYIKGHFSFINDISETMDSLKNLITGVTDTTPVIEADLSLHNSEKYDYGSGKVAVMDFTWYAPYKGVADVVIVAIAYALFFWKLYIRLPSIISGSSAIIDLDTNTKDN